MYRWKHQTGKWRPLASDIEVNNEFLSRVSKEIFEGGEPCNRFWTFDLIDEIKNIVDFSTVKTILDIGSRDCHQSIEFGTWFPQAKIFAFEALPESVREMQNNLALAGGRFDIEIIPKAINSFTGSCVFNRMSGNIGASSLLELGDHPRSKDWRLKPWKRLFWSNNGFKKKQVNVQCIKMSDWLEEKGIDEIDIAWVDVQGAEMTVFKSFESRLKDVKVIQTEVEVAHLYKGSTLKKELDNFLSEKGFECIASYSIDKVSDMQSLMAGPAELDSIYVNRRLLNI